MKEALYSTYKDGKYIGDYKAAKLHEKIGISPKVLYKYVSKGMPYKKHYTFKRRYTNLTNTPVKNLTKEELLLEWDRWRKIVNPEAVNYVRS